MPTWCGYLLHFFRSRTYISRVSNFFLANMSVVEARVLRRCRHRMWSINPFASCKKTPHIVHRAHRTGRASAKTRRNSSRGIGNFFPISAPDSNENVRASERAARLLKSPAANRPAGDACTNKLYGSINRRFGLYCLFSLSLLFLLCLSPPFSFFIRLVN